MGSTGEKIDLESDEEIPFNSSASTNKVAAFEMNHLPPQSVMANSWIARHIVIRAVRSIYIVLLKAKINILLPFGPLAILLHYVTGKHVCIPPIYHHSDHMF
jgi:Ca2+:H+ antiporter